MNRSKSSDLYARARQVIPGGVNSPVRAFRDVGGEPIFMASGSGSWITDVDGNRYLDCVGSWGPLILGHAHPDVIEAVHCAILDGMTFGAPTAAEAELADAIVRAVPSIEMVRLVSSGTEAAMSAARLARGATGRAKIVKFDGNYHGHADFLLARAGSGVATLGLPECAGIPDSITADTISVPYNDEASIGSLFDARGSEIAGIIVEPVCGNMGCVPPSGDFLRSLRRITSESGALLIFDEVMTGFRLALGGAQERFGITPDITVLGKIVGGGLPLAAYGAGLDVMRSIAPLGPVYQAGTLSGNPAAVAAGRATLHILEQRRSAVYGRLEESGERVAQAFRSAAASAGCPVVLNQVGSMITVFFTELKEVTDFETAKCCDKARFRIWFQSMIDSGVYWPPSQFESAFLSYAMSDEDLDHLIRAAALAFLKVGAGGVTVQ